MEDFLRQCNIRARTPDSLILFFFQTEHFILQAVRNTKIEIDSASNGCMHLMHHQGTFLRRNVSLAIQN